MARVRNIIPLDQWPAAHRSALEAALAATRRFNRRRRRFRWKEVSKSGFCKSWGRYLFWARHQSWYTEALPIEALVTPGHVTSFVAHLMLVGNKPATIRHRLSGLERILAALDPRMERGWLKATISELPKTGDRKAKRIRVQLTADLIAFAGWLADQADQLAIAHPRAGARRFGTAAQIMFLSYRPLRLRNLHQLTFGIDLIADQEGEWRLDIPASATKAGNVYDPVLPGRLVDILQRFEPHRSVLGGKRHFGRLWLFPDGTPQSARSIYYQVCKETEAAFGRSMSPHLFRDAAITTVATYMPEHVRMGMNLLGNRDLTCTDEHYNQAGRHLAAAKYNLMLDCYED